MSTTPFEQIIESLHPQRICDGKIVDHGEITTARLALDAVLTKELRMRGLFEFNAWFRLFDKKNHGERILYPGGPVACDDSARLAVFNHAVSEYLLEPHEELAAATSSLPFRLQVLCGTNSFLNRLRLLAHEAEDDCLSDAEANAKRYLRLMRSVDVCLVARPVLAAILNG
jgi:hypothetical protein